MTKRSRTILIVVSAVASVLIVAAGFFVVRFIVRSLTSAEELEQTNYGRPANLDTARVLIGESLWRKSQFPTGQDLGEISEIRVGWPADKEGAQMILVGTRGAQFLDSSGRQTKRVQFSEEGISCRVEIVRLDITGNYAFHTRTDSFFNKVFLFDKEGRKLWGYGSTLPGIDDSAAGDMDGDGKPEFVVGMNGGGGMRLLGSSGQEFAKIPERNVWHVEILDVNGDGRGEILHTNASGQFLVRDMNGKVVDNYLPESNVSQFALTRWGEDTEPRHILVPFRGNISHRVPARVLVLDAQGKLLARYSPEVTGLFNEVEGTPLKSPSGETLYAVLEDYSPWKRSILYIFNSQQKLIYQEIIADTCLGLGTKQDISGQRLLVGCTDTIWAYDQLPVEPRSPEPKPSHNSTR